MEAEWAESLQWPESQQGSGADERQSNTVTFVLKTGVELLRNHGKKETLRVPLRKRYRNGQAS
ncbi:hypothetical protein EYF80_015820 [Liparis tanakae]|uniref:Uncharacterized protein n=1 Tax=Liparis tanakae TaxID=230148 RepID=A0A4Z2I7I1_9TELE|nr:hypothetical protein EYF80_015820 [Liparis tanakae]